MINLTKKLRLKDILEDTEGYPKEGQTKNPMKKDELQQKLHSF